MKNLELNVCDVQVLSLAEMQQIDGGIWVGPLWVDKVVKGVVALITAVEAMDIGERFMEGWNSVECGCE
jgi:hypothetical protein